ICELLERKEKMMTRLFLGAAITAALVVPSTVQAASAHRHKHHRDHHARMMRSAPVHLYGGGYDGYGAYGVYDGGGYGWRGYPNLYTSGPRWASPNQCFVDLGYGRYESCD